jgi:hypothetical protein
VRLDPKGQRARSNLVHAATVLGRPLPPEAQPPAPDAAKTGDAAATETAPKIAPAPADAPKKEAQP